MKRHSNLFAVQACGVVTCPPLPLPSLHRVGGEAPSVPARSYTGLQRTCNQIKHTLHSAQNASIFHDAFLSSFTSLDPTMHASSVLMLCPVWFGWGTFRERLTRGVLCDKCRSLTASSWHQWHRITCPQGSLSSPVSFQKGYRRAALPLLIRNSLHIAVTTV